MGFGNPVQPTKLASDVADAGVTNGTRYWPCRTGETDPPTFDGAGARYTTATGQPSVQVDGSAAPATVSWGSLARYSAISVTRPLVVRFQLYLRASTAYQATLGFGPQAGLVLSAAGGPGAPITVQAVGRPGTNITPPSFGTSIDIGSVTSYGWVDFELVYTRDLTRLTVGQNTTDGRSQSRETSDQRLTAPFRLQQTNTGVSAVQLTNLTVTYPAQLPA